MKAHQKMPNAHGTLPALLLALTMTAAQAGPRTSTDYTISPESTGSGGQRAVSTSYTNDCSAGLIAGVATVASPAETAKAGYIGQLYEVTGLAVNASPASVDETATRQLAAWQVLDDASQIADSAPPIGEPDPMFPGSPGYVTDEILFDTTGLTNVDLDQYQTFKLRLFTPAGQKVTVTHGASYRSGLSIYYQAGGDSSSHTDPAVLQFEDFVGSMPTRNYSLFYIGDSGNVLNFQADEVYPAGSIEFTAMSYSFTATQNPANSPKDFTQQSSFSVPVYFSYQTSSTTDPGPFVTLATISQRPEIEVEQPAGIPLADAGSSIACGTAPVAFNAPAKTFTVKNTGTLDLTLATVTTSGGNAGDFSVNTIGMATAVTPGSSTTFFTTFTLTLGLRKSATLLPGSFESIPFIAEDTQFNEGKIEFQFSSEDPAAFFRLEGR